MKDITAKITDREKVIVRTSVVGIVTKDALLRGIQGQGEKKGAH